MPYGEGPKSGCARRVAVVFDPVRPLTKLMKAAEFGSSGARLMSRFHQFVRGNTCRPAREPVTAGGAAADTSATVAVPRAAASRTDRRDTATAPPPSVPPLSHWLLTITVHRDLHESIRKHKLVIEPA